MPEAPVRRSRVLQVFPFQIATNLGLLGTNYGRSAKAICCSFMRKMMRMSIPQRVLLSNGYGGNIVSIHENTRQCKR